MEQGAACLLMTSHSQGCQGQIWEHRSGRYWQLSAAVKHCIFIAVCDSTDKTAFAAIGILALCARFPTMGGEQSMPQGCPAQGKEG